jgi:large subunit ribosomal protein L16
MFNFSGLLNRKYKKINGKVKFSGVRLIPKNLPSKNFSAIISVGYGLLSASEIDSARKIIRKMVGKNRKIKILTRIFPYIPLTGKPSEVRMGRGKGSRIRKWVCFVKPGKILFEIKNISYKSAFGALTMAAEKLSVNTRIVRALKLKSLHYSY